MLDSEGALCHDDFVKMPELAGESGVDRAVGRAVNDLKGGIAMSGGSETAVVFFSRDGNTRRGAEILAERTSGKLVELKERKKGNFVQALLKLETPLVGDPWREIRDARRIILMTPIWAGNGAPAMNAFASKADFTDKEVYIVTFQQFTDLRLSHKVHQHIAGMVAVNHGSAMTSYALVGGKMGHFAGEEAIRAQIDMVKLPGLAPEPDKAAPAPKDGRDGQVSA